jgi:hypothetical protein
LTGRYISKPGIFVLQTHHGLCTSGAQDARVSWGYEFFICKKNECAAFLIGSPGHICYNPFWFDLNAPLALPQRSMEFYAP